MCDMGAGINMKRLREEASQMRTEVSFQDYGRSLETVSALKYLGRVLTASYDDWPVVVCKYEEGKKAVGTDFKDPRAGGGRTLDTRDL